MIPVGWRPTRKWLAARATALAVVAVMTLETGGFDKPEALTTVALVLEAFVAYLYPNRDKDPEMEG